MSDTPQDPTTPDDTPASDETPTPAQNVGVGGQETPDGAHEISEAEAASRTVTLVDPLDEDEVDRITQIDLNHEMQRSYLDYAMSVIVSAPCRTCATASSPSTAASSTRCSTAATAPTAPSRSARRWSARRSEERRVGKECRSRWGRAR